MSGPAQVDSVNVGRPKLLLINGQPNKTGIDKQFQEQVRDMLQPGTSALFVLTSEAVMDKVHGAFEGQSPELIFTNLSAEEEATLRDVFADA